jgi:chromosome segregation ATPase
MSDYRKSKQHIEGVQNQKNNTEARCANQREQLALMNAQIKNYKELLKECREVIENAWMYDGMATPVRDMIVAKIDNAIGEK